VRPYTPTSASDRPGELEFVIKRYGDGLMSQHVHGLQPGDDVLIKGPISKLPWTGGYEVMGRAQRLLTHVCSERV
jgi:cytochrome-b5 reductase